jgi:DNA-binding beta-propeller fold protein YncE
MNHGWLQEDKLKLVLLLFAALPLAAQQVPGPLANGGVLLDNGWRLRPAGNQTPLSTLPMSAAVSPDGKYILVLNGGLEPPSISVLDAASGREIGRTQVADAWLGLTFSPKGDRVYVGGGSQAAVFEFTFSGGALAPARTFPVVAKEKRTARDFIGDVTFDTAGHLLYVAYLFRDSIVVVNPQSGMVIERFATGRRPYRILFHPDGKSLFVSSWADGAVYHHETANGSLIDKVRLGAHPTDLAWLPGVPAAEASENKPAWVARLFVAAANTNNVYVAGVTEAGDLAVIETINVSMTAWQPSGMTPSALALSPDGKRLYVACSDANAVAVADVSHVFSRPLGFIPTGRYPTAVRALAGNRLVVLNGLENSASFLDAPDEEQLAVYSHTVLENMPYRDTLIEDAGTGAGSPIPARPGDPTPIAHIIYVVREGGAAEQANQDKLAREFALLDNFYPLGDSVAEGQAWSTAAIASDFVRKLGPNRLRLHRDDSEFEGGEPAAAPPSGYLWTNAGMAGLTLRNYGYFVSNRPLKEVAGGVQVQAVRDSILNRGTDLHYRGFDPAYPDTERARAFLADLAEFEKTGQMPQLTMLRLNGLADSDAALGMIVEGLTHSRFWPGAAIFVVDSGARHRATALVISPYVKRGEAGHTMYSTLSVLRTIELILGLRPMTTFDAGAPTLAPIFQKTPDLRPYQAVPR